MDATTLTDGAAGGGIIGGVVIIASKIIDKVRFSKNGNGKGSGISKSEIENMLLNHKLVCVQELQTRFDAVNTHTSEEVEKLRNTIIDLLLEKK